MKRCIVTVILTILVISVMWAYSPKSDEKNEIQVLTVTPKVKNIYDYINANGKIKEANKRDIYINGIARVKSVNVSVGDVVKKDAVLAEIEPVSAGNDAFDSYDIDTSGISSVFEKYGVDLNLDSFEETTRLNIEPQNRIIKSPISGVVTSLNVQAGDNISAINKLISVSDFSDLYVKTLIPEQYSSKIQEGESAEITAEAFGENVYSGLIERIYPVAKYIPSLTGDGQTYIEAVISIENPDGLLRPELNVNTKITSDTIKNAITLPYECIMQDDNNKEYVFCVKNGVAKKCYIDIGFELEEEVEIRRGITEKDLIILSPSEDIKENIKVTEL